MLDKLGFVKFSNPRVLFENDINLLCPLDERCRLERNTFHLNVVKVTIPLKDVHFLIGLLVT